jgi:general secretion pathway protein M
MIKQWFKGLEKREQYILLVGIVAVVFYLLYGVMYRGLVNARDRYEQQNITQQETLVWMQGAVQTIQALERTGSKMDVSEKSLAELAEEAAKAAEVRIGRFQPKDDNEAQVWLEQEKFNNVLTFLGRLELDYGLSLEDVSITSANTPGIVNLRLKFSK